MSAEEKRLPLWLRNTLFAFGVLTLSVFLGWQIHALLAYIKPDRAEENREPAETRVIQYKAFVPDDMLFSGGDGTFLLSQPSQGEYSFLKFLGQQMLQRALHSEEGRSIAPESFFSDTTGFFYQYSCGLPKLFFEELGAPPQFLSACPSEGIDEIRFYPAAYYWQDSSVILCNRRTGFAWKFVIYGKQRSSADQANLDYFVDLLAQPHPTYESYVQEESGLLVFADRDYTGRRSFELVPFFADSEGALNTADAEQFANRVFSYADTMSTWTFSPYITVFTNEYATLRIQSDGGVFYSGLSVHEPTVSMLAAYEVAYDFVKRPTDLAYNSAVSVRPIAYAAEGGSFTFTFAYYFRGMRIREIDPMKVAVRNNDVLNFSGRFYRFVPKNPAEQDYYSWEEWRALFETGFPGTSPELGWLLYEGAYYPVLDGDDASLLPFELPPAEEPDENGIEQSAAENGSSEEDAPAPDEDSEAAR